jgi:hypothetical protein
MVFGTRDALTGEIVPAVTAEYVESRIAQGIECSHCRESEARWWLALRGMRRDVVRDLYCEPCMQIIGMMLAPSGAECEVRP